MLRNFVLQDAVFDGMMRSFAHEAQGDVRAAVAGYREAGGVATALLRQARAARGVSEVAAVGKFLIAERFVFLTGNGTMAAPTSTQRKARRVQPEAILHSFRRHEERTSHD